MSDPGERRRTWLVGLLVALLLSGCTAAPGRSASPTPATTSSPTPSTTTSSGPGPDLHTVADRILHRRAAAVRGDDRQAFLADVAHRDPRFVARQRRLFDNLVQLPLQVFRLRATASIWSASFAARRWRGKAYLPYVSQTMQLRGFDPRPITTLYGVTLARTGGAWKIVSDTDVDSQIAADAHSAPWEVTRIDVRRSPRVLGIFDAGSLGHAATTMQRAEAGVATVTRDVPLRWRPRAVVYDLSQERVLDSIGRRFLDRQAVAFPVLDNSENPTTRVATRVLINPRFSQQDPVQGQYLLTHEITHVALGRTNYGTPAWVQEGLADFVATRRADPTFWRPRRSSVREARRGVDSMPVSATFGDKHAAFEYDLSLLAIRYLADTFGEASVWRLVKAMDRASTNGFPDDDQDAVLRRAYGLDSHQLARRAGRLLVARGRG